MSLWEVIVDLILTLLVYAVLIGIPIFLIACAVKWVLGVFV